MNPLQQSQPETIESRACGQAEIVDSNNSQAAVRAEQPGVLEVAAEEAKGSVGAEGRSGDCAAAATFTAPAEAGLTAALSAEGEFEGIPKKRSAPMLASGGASGTESEMAVTAVDSERSPTPSCCEGIQKCQVAPDDFEASGRAPDGVCMVPTPSASGEGRASRPLASAELKQSRGCHANAGVSVADSTANSGGGMTNGETDGNTGRGREGDRSGNAPRTISDGARGDARPPGAGEKRLTEAALLKGAERVRILKAARPLFATNTLEEIAALLGTSAPTLCRLKRDYAHLPDEELTPENCAAEFTNSGRPSPYEALAQDMNVRRRLEELYLLSCGASSDYMTKGRRTGSAAATLKVFSRDPLCPPLLAEELRRGKQPAPLLRVIRQVTDLMEQRSRGTKHASLHGTVTMRRSLLEILEDGQQVRLQPGDWWVFDDMSDNMPHYWVLPDGTAAIGRQGLYAYDVTRRWLGVEKVGTVRDSYTAAIILRFLRRLMETFGKPRRGVVFERSVWQSRAITGCRITAAGDLVDEEIDRPGILEDEKALIQDGLESLGLKVHYTYTPRGKEIESAFNYLQRLKPMFQTQSAERGPRNGLAINIGRHAGEYEHGAKQLRRVRAGSHHPADLGFLHIDASRDLDLQVMEFINAEIAHQAGPGPTKRQSGSSALPYPELAALSERDLAVFLPETRALELRNGKVTATVAGQPYDFCAPELFASLGSGYRVFIKFDPSEPTLGAAIYNRETSSSNFRGYQVGEFIGFAPFLPEVARFDHRTEKDDPAGDIKKRFNGFVRTSFGAVGFKHARASAVRDGRGQVAEVKNAAGAGSGVSGKTGERVSGTGAENSQSLRAESRAEKSVPLPYWMRRAQEISHDAEALTSAVGPTEETATQIIGNHEH